MWYNSIMSERVISYDSWTEWNTSNHTDPTTILYTGPTIKCSIDEIRVKYKTSKYIIVLKESKL